MKSVIYWKNKPLRMVTFIVAIPIFLVFVAISGAILEVREWIDDLPEDWIDIKQGR